VSIFFRRARERRDINMSDWIRGIDAGGTTKSGVAVTSDRALRVAAMWASVNLLASTVANLPVDVFRGSGTNKQALTVLPALVARPSLIVTRREWVYQAMVSLLLRGNAYGLILGRDGSLRPSNVEWLNPDDVTVSQKSSLSPPTYKVGQEDILPADMVHLRAFVRPGSAVGMSPVEYHAEMLGMSIAARDYGAGWFAGGGHPTAVFQNKTQPKISPDQAETIKDRFLATLRGKREPLVIGSDWNYTPIQAAAAESQFLEAMGYDDAQIARLYGPGLAEVLGYGTQGSSLSYSNRVDRSLDLSVYTVMPWVTKFEDFWTDSIAVPQTARMNLNSLMRSDNKTRHETYLIDRQIGLYNIDEIRALEDLPPLPDGQGQDYTPIKGTTPNTDQGGPQ
jgi:HK97 family phage portal protein